jgi:hypothetical protein
MSLLPLRGQSVSKIRMYYIISVLKSSLLIIGLIPCHKNISTSHYQLKIKYKYVSLIFY